MKQNKLFCPFFFFLKRAIFKTFAYAYKMHKKNQRTISFHEKNNGCFKNVVSACIEPNGMCT